jgi:hypothetical protein
MAYEIKFLLSLLLTLCIETPVLWIILRVFYKYNKDALPSPMIIFAGFIVSFATLPYVWFIFPFFIRTYLVYMIASECFAFLLESVFYVFILKVSIKRACVLSFLCNAVSFLAGEGLKAFIPPG